MASLRTLIVDDSDAMRHVLRSVLNGYHGVEVVGEATNGEEALQQVQTLAPDLIIMDVCMPALDGTERRRMRQEKSPGNRHLDVLSSSHSGLRRKRKKNGGWVGMSAKTKVGKRFSAPWTRSSTIAPISRTEVFAHCVQRDVY